MNKNKIKQVIDACYKAKRIRDMLPSLPNGVTQSHIHYLDTILKLESEVDEIKVSDLSNELKLPRPSVTKTIKDMERLGFLVKENTECDGRVVFIKITALGKEMVDKYVNQYFSSLEEELNDISDKDADKMIEMIDKLYIVMNRRQQ